MSTQRHACTRRRMFEYRSQHIIRTSHIYFLFSPRAQFAAVLYCDERQMSKSRESAEEREREKKDSQSVSLDGQPTMDDNDSKRLGRFSLKKYIFSRPSRDHHIARGVSWFFLYSWLPRCGRTRRRRRGRVYSAPMSSLFYYRLWLRGFSLFSPQICRAFEGPEPCAEIIAAVVELIRFLWKKDVCVPGPVSSRIAEWVLKFWKIWS